MKRKSNKLNTSMSFRVEIHAVDAAGNDIDVPPVTSVWGPQFATKWHENHLDMNVRTMFTDMIARVQRKDTA